MLGGTLRQGFRYRKIVENTNGGIVYNPIYTYNDHGYFKGNERKWQKLRVADGWKRKLSRVDTEKYLDDDVYEPDNFDLQES